MAFVASVHAKAIDLIKLSLDMTTAAAQVIPRLRQAWRTWLPC